MAKGYNVDYETRNFRHALEILSHGHEWHEIRSVISAITPEDIVAKHVALNEPLTAVGKSEIAGGQTAMNALFRERLEGPPLQWRGQPALFDDTSEVMQGWTMDFLKNRIGVEVSFNHAEAIPWTFTRLNIAGESADVMETHRIDAGIAIFADQTLKKWARMDNSVGRFDKAWTWLGLMKPIMPIPVLVVGLYAKTDGIGWPPTDVFRGTKKGKRRAGEGGSAGPVS